MSWIYVVFVCAHCLQIVFDVKCTALEGLSMYGTVQERVAVGQFYVYCAMCEKHENTKFSLFSQNFKNFFRK